MPMTAGILKRAKTLYQMKHYDDQACKKCEYLSDRHCDVCDDCPAYRGEIRLWKRKEIAGVEHIGVPKGNRKKLKKWTVDPIRIRDLRPKNAMRTPVKWTGKLRPHQIPAVKAVIAAKYGVLKAPPRSGKTAMATYISCKLGLKTLILANQHDLLIQFQKTFEDLTNIRDVEKFEGKKLMGICKSPEEMKGLDIVFATYQSFITKNGKLRLKEIRRMFPLIIIDEVHKAAATTFAQTLLGFNGRYVFGLTGTDDRKDGLYKIVKDIIGPVTGTCVVETLIPTVEVIDTKATTSTNYKHWTFAMRYLANHKERNALIVKHAVHDIKSGRSLVIPVTLVKHARELCDAINKAMGKEVAVAFTSNGLTKARREQILADASSYKIKCVVGIRSLVQTGINVPRWDTLYEVMPISNVPNFTQETSRIRTVEPGKKPTLIKHFIEVFGPSTGCFRTCFFQTYKKERFIMSKETVAKCMAYLATKKQSGSALKFEIV